jgi:hypothetical protein
MTQLLDSPELAERLGQAAQDKVGREYSLDCLLRRTENLYVTLLERRGVHLYRSVTGTANV